MHNKMMLLAVILKKAPFRDPTIPGVVLSFPYVNFILSTLSKMM